MLCPRNLLILATPLVMELHKCGYKATNVMLYYTSNLNSVHVVKGCFKLQRQRVSKQCFVCEVNSIKVYTYDASTHCWSLSSAKKTNIVTVLDPSMGNIVCMYMLLQPSCLYI